MSNNRYVLDHAKENALRGTAKLLSVTSARYEGDWHSMPHTHSCMELFYIAGGKGQFLIENNLYPVDADQLILVGPNVLHTEVSYNANPLEYIVLGIEGLKLSIGEDFDSRFRILDCRNISDIPPCLRSILREMKAQQPGYEHICQAYMEIVILRLMRNTGLSIPETPAAATGSRQCASARHYIDMHYKEPLNLELLAEEAHINKYYLSHAFKREFGMSPMNYMITRRIEESKYLLKETDLSLSQIARLLGFSSASYFSQSFRRAENMTPMEYRKNASPEIGEA